MKVFRWISAVLAALCTMSLTACQPKIQDNALVFLACSDFQHWDGHETSAAHVQVFLNVLREAGYDRADGAFFCGDYNFDFDDSDPGLALLTETVLQTFSMDADDLYFVQGNHDPTDTAGLTPAGANDRVRDDGTAEFGIYILHEDDYMWSSTERERIRDTAAHLEAYLNEKIEESYTRPIFILAHLPLHYSMRSIVQDDTLYANLLFDVINEAGQAGLNIFYLFGHNHSKGWDDYLGGSAIYLTHGDTLPVAQGSADVWEAETLAFTYLNAGYLGYYPRVNDGAETDLSMTVFQITDDSVMIERYTAAGLHDLKSPGVSNLYLDEPNLTSLIPDSQIYKSPQILPLNKQITP